VGVRNRFMYLVCRFVVSCRGWLLETSERDRPQSQNGVGGFRRAVLRQIAYGSMCQRVVPLQQQPSARTAVSAPCLFNDKETDRGAVDRQVWVRGLPERSVRTQVT